MANAQNGARIKAFAGFGVGSGSVKNITFSGFTETNVDNPVIIDQVRSLFGAQSCCRADRRGSVVLYDLGNGVCSVPIERVH